MARRGRPRLENAKNNILCVRVDEVTYQRLKKSACDNNTTISELIYLGIGELLTKESKRK